MATSILVKVGHEALATVDGLILLLLQLLLLMLLLLLVLLLSFSRVDETSEFIDSLESTRNAKTPLFSSDIFYLTLDIEIGAAVYGVLKVNRCNQIMSFKYKMN